MKGRVIISILLISFFCVAIFSTNNIVLADDLSSNISDQLNNLDLNELEDFFNGIKMPNGNTFLEVFHKLLNGQFDSEANNLLGFIVNIVFDNALQLLPIFISVLIIAILFSIIHDIKGQALKESVSKTLDYICFFSVVLILSASLIGVFGRVENLIENIAKLNEIMSPIILTLMVSSGATASASVYKPSVIFLSDGIITIILNIVIPLVVLLTIFCVLSFICKDVRLNKFSDFIKSILKWIFGIIITVFGVFTSIQGISSAVFDGISIKAAKFAISNSVPIVGGILKDGFDVVIAGSILIKNTIGIASIFIYFYVVLSNILFLAVFSMLLKLTSAFCDSVGNVQISNFLTNVSKSISYLVACVLLISFMFFITIILMIFSANAFI